MADLSTSASMAFRRRPLVRRLVAATLFLVVFAAGVWLERAALLQGAADLWTVSDPVTRSDVVVVLGGGVDMRPFIAAELYKKDLVSKVLVSQVAETRSSNLLALPGHSERNRMVLQKLGVPDAAIEMFGGTSKNTKDEAVALRDWANRHGVSSMVIPTEIFASRRVQWIFNREFGGSSVRLEIPAFEPGYTRAEWWKTEAGMTAFQNEIMKYLYYRLKY
jgi:uncharacterized SAM-binding protein YcdF (DUF218 family)